MINHSTVCAGTGAKIFKVLGTLFLIGVISVAIYMCIFVMYVKNNLMDEVDVSYEDFFVSLSSVIYYNDPETGKPKELVTIESGETRKWIDYEDIPIDFEHAFVSIEDERFYKHNGVDWYRTAGAFVNMFLNMKNTFGGSTITQQLVKNVTEYNENTVRRKLVEIFRAMEFERKYDKWQIIQWYLNEIYFGHGQYGIVAASEYYFGKDVSELSLAEITSIVGITNNPSMYSPYLDKEENKERQELILGKMLELEYIDKATYDAAKAEELHFVPDHSSSDGSMSDGTHYSYFADAVIEDVIAGLMESKNVSYDVAERLLLTGGYKIYSTMNPDIQADIDAVYTDLSKAPSSKNSKKLQSAIVVVDPFTGNIVGMSGGLGQKEGDRVLNRATQTQRPPGSSFKPIATYGPAVEYGLITPGTLFEDTDSVKLTGTDWMPMNDDRKYNDIVDLRTAINKSLNTVAAQVMDMLTPQKSYEFLTQKLGITSLLEYRDGKSDIDYAPLALGQLTDGITVREMASAYTIFVNGGTWTEGRTYTAIYDSNDQLVYENIPETTQAVSEKTAYWITNMLSNAVSYGTGTTARLSDMPTAGKTGTSTNNQDRWFCGYTPYYVAAVWSGYDIPSRLSVTGSSNPSAKLFNLVMTRIHEDLEYKSFTKPEDTYLKPVEGVKAVDYIIRCVDAFGNIIYEEPHSGVIEKVYTLEAPEVENYIPVAITKDFQLLEDPTKNIVVFLYNSVITDVNYTIRCEDLAGNVIHERVETGLFGQTVTVLPPALMGYEPIETSQSVILGEKTVVTFSYKTTAPIFPIDPLPNPDGDGGGMQE